MARSIRFSIILFLAAVSAYPQGPPSAQTLIPVRTAPSGGCGGNTARLVAPSGDVYTCVNGTWTKLSGGGGSTTPQYTTVSFSSTPTFTATSVISGWTLTLTGNVASSTWAGITKGQFTTVELCQDGTGGRSFFWPTNTVGGATITSTINSAVSSCLVQVFVYDGTNQVAATGGVIVNGSGSKITLQGSSAGYINVVPPATVTTPYSFILPPGPPVTDGLYLSSLANGAQSWLPVGTGIVSSNFGVVDQIWNGIFNPSGVQWAFQGPCAIGTSHITDVAGSPDGVEWTGTNCTMIYPANSDPIPDFLSGSTPLISQITFRGGRTSGTGELDWGWSQFPANFNTSVTIRFASGAYVGVVRSSSSDLATCSISGAAIDFGFHTYTIQSTGVANTITYTIDTTHSCTINTATIPGGAWFGIVGSPVASAAAFKTSEQWILIKGNNR